VIGRLTGVVSERGLDGCCVLDVSGVGYEVFVPLRSVGELAQPPEPVTLHVHTHVREEALTLFAFCSPEDRIAFRILLGVNGLGPKLAMAILSDLDAAGLGSAVARDDAKRLTAISGVGKKMSARLLLELKDKLPKLAAAAGTPLRHVAAPRLSGPGDEAVATLVNMGFSRGAAESAVASVANGHELPMESLLRSALRSLA
jgi:Holliday junction DNA helicase RuvA